MKSSIRLAVAAAALLPAGSSLAASFPARSGALNATAGQVFVQTDAASGNSVAVYDQTAGAGCGRPGPTRPAGSAGRWSGRSSTT